jgi:hypothetical protein
MKKCTEWKASRKCGICAKSWTRWMKCHFFDRWHVGSLVWNMQANFKRGLKNRGPIAVKFAFGCLRRARSTINFWPLKYGCALLPFLFAWFYPLRFLRVYENEVAASRSPWNSGTIADIRTLGSEKSVPTVLPTVAESLEPLQELFRVQRTKRMQQCISCDWVRKLLYTPPFLMSMPLFSYF